MTEPLESELLELATPYALDAVSDSERAAIETRVAQASAAVAAFDDEVCLYPRNNGRRLGIDTGRAASGSTRAAAGVRHIGLGTPIPLAHHLSSRQPPRLPSGSAP